MFEKGKQSISFANIILYFNGQCDYIVSVFENFEILSCTIKQLCMFFILYISEMFSLFIHIKALYFIVTLKL